MGPWTGGGQGHALNRQRHTAGTGTGQGQLHTQKRAGAFCLNRVLEQEGAGARLKNRNWRGLRALFSAIRKTPYNATCQSIKSSIVLYADPYLFKTNFGQGQDSSSCTERGQYCRSEREEM
eukprot:505491-Pelagomonas_calceolata.AAC.3